MKLPCMVLWSIIAFSRNQIKTFFLKIDLKKITIKEEFLPISLPPWGHSCQSSGVSDYSQRLRRQTLCIESVRFWPRVFRCGERDATYLCNLNAVLRIIITLPHITAVAFVRANVNQAQTYLFLCRIRLEKYQIISKVGPQVHYFIVNSAR